MRFAFAGLQTDDGDPGHGNRQGNVVEASAVIDVAADGPIGDVRTGGVGEAGAEQIGVENFPATLAPQPGQHQGAQKRQFLDEVQRVQIVVVGRNVGHDVLPRDDDEHVEIDPPNHHQGKIEAAETRGILILRSMRTEGKSGHQRHDVQEKDHVAGAQVRDIGAQPEFVVDPDELVGKPEANAGSDERPEQAQTPARSHGVRDKGKRPGKQQEALHHVAESSEAKGVRQNQCSQDQSRQTGCDCGGPELGIGAQGSDPRCHSRPGSDEVRVTEVTGAGGREAERD